MLLHEVNKKYKVVSHEMYKSLNDAAVISPDLAKGSTKVWYAKSTRDLGMGYDWCAKKNCLPDIEDLKKTHVLLGSVKGTNKEKIFGLLQGEIWSPNGEAHNLIDKSGAKHTSMSVGDIIEMDGKMLYGRHAWLPRTTPTNKRVGRACLGHWSRDDMKLRL